MEGLVDGDFDGAGHGYDGVGPVADGDGFAGASFLDAGDNLAPSTFADSGTSCRFTFREVLSCSGLL